MSDYLPPRRWKTRDKGRETKNEAGKKTGMRGKRVSPGKKERKKKTSNDVKMRREVLQMGWKEKTRGK